jgi:hypothetical protein
VKRSDTMSEQSPIYHEPATPDVDAILNDAAASVWLKEALRAALQRDPMDAVRDAELLVAVLARRCATLQASKATP